MQRCTPEDASSSNRGIWLMQEQTLDTRYLASLVIVVVLLQLKHVWLRALAVVSCFNHGFSLAEIPIEAGWFYWLLFPWKCTGMGYGSNIYPYIRGWPILHTHTPIFPWMFFWGVWSEPGPSWFTLETHHQYLWNKMTKWVISWLGRFMGKVEYYLYGNFDWNSLNFKKQTKTVQKNWSLCLYITNIHLTSSKHLKRSVFWLKQQKQNVVCNWKSPKHGRLNGKIIYKWWIFVDFSANHLWCSCPRVRWYTESCGGW